ncbi:MAG: HEPN domain-containing protein [Methylocystis sp.]|nr:HEPN domain-containing protein [Methylocystis sp.]
MTQPETFAYLAKAQQALKEARIVLANDLAEAAGRAAYHAAYHAAQAFIFERTGKAAKSHNGVRSEFARLAKEEPGIDRSFSAFLARAYNLKARADYAIGDDISVSVAEAGQAIESAAQFVEGISRLLAPQG